MTSPCLTGPAELPPEDSAQIVVGFAPTAPVADATLTLSTNAPDRTEADITLAGTGYIPELTLSPAMVDFDSVLVDCVDTEELPLTNSGQADLTVDAVLSSTNSITIASDCPIDLAPGSSQTIERHFTPEEDRVYTSTLTANSNAANVSSVTARGVGTWGATIEERFRQSGNRRHGRQRLVRCPGRRPQQH